MRPMPRSTWSLMIPFMFAMLACGAGDEPPNEPTAASPDASMEIRTHDPAHAPIDCPLREAGVSKGELRPFEDMEAYIAFLEREDRATWQKADEVIQALGLDGSEIIADVGAGSGYFTFRFAAAVPRGRVVAIDVEPEMVRHVHHKATTDGIGNVEARLAPGVVEVPKDADLVFTCDVLHHVTDREAWLAELFRTTRPGARLVLIEFREGELPEGPPADVKIPRAELIRLVENAGFTLEDEKPELLPYQVFLVFRRP